MENTTFPIIQFESANQGFVDSYFPEGLAYSGLWQDLVKHASFKQLISEKIPLGTSRYGGAVVDFPKTMTYPKEKTLRFMAQLDLSAFSPYDKSGVLPPKGQLYFFMYPADKGHVIYYPGDNTGLERVFIEDPNQIWGDFNALTNIRPETERWYDCYAQLDPEELECTVCGKANFLDCTCDYTGMLPFERDEIVDREYIWEPEINFKSKLFGIYSDVQLGEKEIEAVMTSDDVVLLQVGEDINREGIFSVLINKNELKKGDFAQCKFRWSQT